MTTFHSYDPSSRFNQSQPKACEACYVRKIRCDFSDGKLTCRNCIASQAECRPRTRKRKAASVDNNAQQQHDSVSSARRRNTESGAVEKRQRTDNENGSSPSVHNDPPSPRAHQQQADSDDLAAPFLFIGQRNKLASSPGTTADALTSSIDEFHNSSYLSRSAILGDDFPDIDHSHEPDPQQPFKLSPTEMEVLRLFHAFDLPELPLRQSLIEAFTEKCSTWMPVVDVPSLSAGLPCNETSLLLLQAVILVGASMRPDICNKLTLDSYYHRVKALVNSSYERNPLNILAALCLIQWYTPTAPKDVSTDTPRFWESCAIGIAQQVGLHQQPKQKTNDFGLRRRIWWTLYVRDSLMAAAHGRPRMLNITDSTMDKIVVDDFDNSSDIKAQIFVAYAGVTEVLCDLCQSLIRQASITSMERSQIASRLLECSRTLPASLRLHNLDGSQRSYDFEIAQLHVPLLTTLAILHRPGSIFSLTSSNAASITAANLIYRIFEAIQLREQTRQLSSAFAWFLLVAAIPHLSCLRVPALRLEAGQALNTLEGVLQTLGTVRPAAANNLRNVRAIRKAISTREAVPSSSSKTSNCQSPTASGNQDAATVEVLRLYGPQAIQNLESLTRVLTDPEERDQQVVGNPTAINLDAMTGNEQPIQPILPDDGDNIPVPDLDAEFGDGFFGLFGEHFQENTWMRNWIDDLQPFPD